MTHLQALTAIKELREKINDHSSGGWVNRVLFYLDFASDVIEFPEPNGEVPWD